MEPRDEFAKAAMQALLSRGHYMGFHSPQAIAETAYSYADAMLAEMRRRNRQQEQSTAGPSRG
jgi:hypothetical protein